MFSPEHQKFFQFDHIKSSDHNGLLSHNQLCFSKKLLEGEAMNKKIHAQNQVKIKGPVKVFLSNGMVQSSD